MSLVNFLKYTPGSRPGKRKAPEKQTQTEQEKKEKRDSYEKGKRPDRAFDDLWIKNWPWLVFDSKENVMRCSVCIKFSNTYSGSTSSFENLKNKYQFLSGCKNFKTSSIKDHAQSKMHQDATARKTAELEPSTTVAYASIISLNEHQRKQLEVKFRNMHAIVMNNRPLSDFTWMNKLDRAKGIYSSDTYNNPHAAATFVEYIASVEQDRLTCLADEIKFFSLSPGRIVPQLFCIHQPPGDSISP